MAAVAVGGTKEYRLTQLLASDREVLRLLSESVDEDGYAESFDVASTLWPRTATKQDEKARQCVQAVGMRLSYMSRVLGVVERVKVGSKIKWSLTDRGEAMLEGKLRAAVERELEGMDTAKAALAMLSLATRAKHRNADGTLITRAFRFSSQRR